MGQQQGATAGACKHMAGLVILPHSSGHSSQHWVVMLAEGRTTIKNLGSRNITETTQEQHSAARGKAKNSMLHALAEASERVQGQHELSSPHTKSQGQAEGAPTALVNACALPIWAVH